MGGGLYSPFKSNLKGHSLQGQNELYLGLRLEKHLNNQWSIFPGLRAFFRGGEFSRYEGNEILVGTNLFIPRYGGHYSKARGLDLQLQTNYRWSPHWLLSSEMNYRFLNFHDYGAAAESSPAPFDVQQEARFLHLVRWDLDLNYSPSNFFLIRAGLRASNEIYTGFGWMEYDWMIYPQLQLRVILD